MFKSRENTAMNAAILCPAVCLSDVINKAEKHGNVHVVANVHEPTIFCLSLVKNKPTWLHWGELKFDAPLQKSISFASILTEQLQQVCQWKYLHGGGGGGYVFKPTCVFGSVFHFKLLWVVVFGGLFFNVFHFKLLWVVFWVVFKKKRFHASLCLWVSFSF